MTPAYHLVIPAAGIGSRFQSSIPKQYVEIAGKPLVHHAIASSAIESCKTVVVALADGDPYWQAPVSHRNVLTAKGGQQRSDSVLSALHVLHNQGVEGSELVLVHDAARPYVPKGDIVDLLLAAAASKTGAILAAPVADTVKRVSTDGSILATVERSDLWRALTPQAFRLDVLIDALTFCAGHAIPVTDEASAVEARGGTVKVVQGSAANIKVTLPEDIHSVASYMEQQS